MTVWNFDISQAPGPKPVRRETKRPDGSTVTYDEMVPTWVLVAVGNEDRQVMSSCYLPARPMKNAKGKEWPARWHGLATGQVPLAWMPYPDHPEVK